jgi:hypothetical protein
MTDKITVSEKQKTLAKTLVKHLEKEGVLGVDSSVGAAETMAMLGEETLEKLNQVYMEHSFHKLKG